jgi:hypothetical protein
VELEDVVLVDVWVLVVLVELVEVVEEVVAVELVELVDMVLLEVEVVTDVVVL